MLRISKKADYAVFLLGAIARRGAFPGGEAQDAVVSAHEIARESSLNKSVVANLLKEFARNNLLDSVRGLRGGYRLTCPPSEISLGQILEVVEGKFELVDCIGHQANNPPQAADAKANGLPANAVALPAAETTQGERTQHTSDCCLIGFCPSKQPMRIVHQRISKLFHEIHLDELCSMTPMTNHQVGVPTAVGSGGGFN